jgi:tetratricopeptide (TPR) repeat protein/class 3 adenylate cyclase
MFLTQAQNPAPAAAPLALVFTDIVGSSAAKRASTLGNTTSLRDSNYLDAIQARHLQLVRQCLAAHRGKEIMTIGDAFFLTFDDVREAVFCCAEIQSRLATEPILTANGPLRLRIGIHVGAPKFFENSWHGTDVDTAARAEAVASPAQIILTDAARLHFGTLPDMTLRRLGTFTLKGIGDIPLWDVDYDHHGLRHAAIRSVEQAQRGNLTRILALLLLVLIATGGYLYQRHRSRLQQASSQAPLAPKDSIILSGINNETGDPVFDSILTEAFAIQLEQSPVLNLVSQQHLRQSMHYLGKSPDAPLTPDLAREMGERQGVKAILSGSIVKLGSTYIISLTAVNTRSGDTLAHEQGQAADKDHVLEVVGQIATNMRSRLGESLSSIQKLDTPFGQATTTSLEAFRAYALGDVAHEKGLDIPEAQGHYQKAIDLDPNFAMAWARLGVVYGNSGEKGQALVAFQKAMTLSTNVSERERLYILGHYYYNALGNLPKAIETQELALRTYPHDLSGAINLGDAQAAMGDYAASIVSFKNAMVIDPNDGLVQTNLFSDYAALDMIPEATALANSMHQQHLDDGTQALVYLYLFYFLQGDAAQTQAVLQRAEGRADQYQLTGNVAQVHEFLGQYKAASDLWYQATDQAATQKAPDAQAFNLLMRISGRATAGLCDTNTKDVRAAFAIDRSKATLVQGVFAASLCGDKPDTLPLLEKLGHDYPQDTIIQQVIIPQSRAALALYDHQPQLALHYLQDSRPFDLSTLSAYLRGLTYLQLHDGPNAVDSFQRASRYKGNCLQSLQDYGQALLGLARAYILNNNKPAAQKTYENLFNVWKSADPDLPQLLAAKKEYAAL